MYGTDVDAEPDEDGTFSVTLPKSGNTVKIRPLTLGDTQEIERMVESYPPGRIAPKQTLRLNKMIVSVDGSVDRELISKFIESMPIMDSKHIKNFIDRNEPKLDLRRQVITPSGKEISVNILFGVEFFRPFF